MAHHSWPSLHGFTKSSRRLLNTKKPYRNQTNSYLDGKSCEPCGRRSTAEPSVGRPRTETNNHKTRDDPKNSVSHIKSISSRARLSNQLPENIRVYKSIRTLRGKRPTTPDAGVLGIFHGVFHWCGHRYWLGPRCSISHRGVTQKTALLKIRGFLCHYGL